MHHVPTCRIPSRACEAEQPAAVTARIGPVEGVAAHITIRAEGCSNIGVDGEELGDSGVVIAGKNGAHRLPVVPQPISPAPVWGFQASDPDARPGENVERLNASFRAHGLEAGGGRGGRGGRHRGVIVGQEGCERGHVGGVVTAGIEGPRRQPLDTREFGDPRIQARVQGCIERVLCYTLRTLPGQRFGSGVRWAPAAPSRQAPPPPPPRSSGPWGRRDGVRPEPRRLSRSRLSDAGARGTRPW